MKLVVMTAIIVGLLIASFLATTWAAMILAGMIGHLTDSTWLMRLSFWDCAPVWVIVILLKFMFKG